jgi:hypothetical protein
MHKLYRIIGAGLFLIGLAALGFGLYGMVVASDLSARILSSSHGTSFDADAWASHFRLQSFAATVVGALTLVGGAAVICRRAWGFIFVAGSAVLAGLFPWLLKAFRDTPLECGAVDIAESCVLAVVAFIALFAFTRTRSKSDA